MEAIDYNLGDVLALGELVARLRKWAGQGITSELVFDPGVAALLLVVVGSAVVNIEPALSRVILV
jgi:hypothetical protein